MKTIEGTKSAPNGKYYGNIFLSDGKGKAVMFEETNITGFDYIVFSNSTRARNDKSFKPVDGKPNWVYKFIRKDEIRVYQYFQTLKN